MDTVEKTIGNASFISELVNIKQFKKSYIEEIIGLNKMVSSASGTSELDESPDSNKELKCTDLQCTSDVNLHKKIKMTMGIESDMLASLQMDCGPSTLDGEGEPQIEIMSKKSSKRLLNRIPSGLQLSTINLQLEDLKKRITNNNFRTSTNWFWRIQTKVDFPVISGMSKHLNVKGDIDNHEVILIVQIFRPTKHDTHLNFTKSRKSVRTLEQEMAVLGSQSLTELREKIACVSDETIACELSANPNEPPAKTAKEVYKSGFFYINGTFYNDTRDPKNKDYSQVIQKWASDDPSLNLGPFKTAQMEHTTFLDLEVKLGYPYVYQHQGDCEHVLVFSDLRMFHPEDSSCSSIFPLPTRYLAKRRVSCMLCNTATANWITYGNERVWDQPFYFCNACFHSYNYTEENEKIGNFKAYHYIDRNAL